MTEPIDAAVMQVMVAAELDLPLDARSLQIQLRQRADELCAALLWLIEELPDEHRQELKQRWQYAQVMSSMWQVYAYAVGQPMALEYVQSAFTAASRRAQALADLIYTNFAPAHQPPNMPMPEPQGG